MHHSTCLSPLLSEIAIDFPKHYGNDSWAWQDPVSAHQLSGCCSHAYESIKILKYSLFKYFCLKEASASNRKLPGMKSFVSHKYYGGEENEVGNKIVIANAMGTAGRGKTQ